MRAAAARLLVVASLLVTAGSEGREWPSFRGPGAAGVAPDAKPPVRWSASAGDNVRWKTPIPGFAHASPVVWGERIFVATAVPASGEAAFRGGLYGDIDSAGDRNEQSWMLLALDRRNGEVLWQKTAARGTPRVDRHLKSSHANSTPATDGRHVVALFSSHGGIFCYTVEGELVWSRDLGRLDAGWLHDASLQWGHASSPVLWQDRVIVQVDRSKGSYLAAFRLTDGAELWRTPRSGPPSWGTPTVVEGPRGPELVTQGGDAARGYDPQTGAELWRLAPISDITVATPFAAGGLVYLSNGYRPVQPLYAVEPGGRGDLSLPEGKTAGGAVAWVDPQGGSYLPTPIAVGDFLYVLSNNGVLTTYDAARGERLHRQRVGGGGSAFSASPVAAGGRLYLAAEDGDVHVLAAGSEPRELAVNAMGEGIMATPAIAGDLLLVRTARHLWALGEKAAPAASESKPGG